MKKKISNPDISVVIPTFGREEILVDTIKDVLKQNYTNFELVVVDQTENHNESTKEYLLNNKDPRLRYFFVKPPSLTAARNFALNVSRAPIIIYIDDDVILCRDFIKEHLCIYKDYPNVMAVAGRVVDLVHKWPESDKPLYFDKYGMGHNSFNCNTSQFSESFPGGNMSVNVNYVRRLGGFDTRYNRTAVREESDLAMRIRNAGGKIFFSSRASLRHLAAPYGGTRIRVNPLDNIAYYSNELYFTIKFVKLKHLPIGIMKRLKHAMSNVGCLARARRLALFTVGLGEGLIKRIYYRTIIASEVEN